MADITYSMTATERKSGATLVPGKGEAGSLKMLVCSVQEVPASASGSTIFFGRIPSNARISNLSRVYWDDLSTTGSPTLDIGLASVDANVTSDPDAFSAGHDVTSADTSGEPMLDLFEASGDYAWDFVNGQTTDPGGALDVYGSIVDAATAGLTGTVMVEVYGYLD